ncbi:MAG: MBL fold metallo-hydrolase, partial [Bacteroidetes bacterium]
YPAKAIHLLDVRRASEYNTEHLVGAVNFPLDFINRNMNQLERNTPYYLHCAGGYRSVIAASILKARGFQQLVNIKGGYAALAKTSLKRTEHVDQLTEL